LILFSVAVWADCPKARLPSSVQGNDFYHFDSLREEHVSQSLASTKWVVWCDMQDFKIQNMVASCDVKFPIRLEGLALASGVFANVRSQLRS
jgi:hypothetical protein